jgi:hypothetical protein
MTKQEKGSEVNIIFHRFFGWAWLAFLSPPHHALHSSSRWFELLRAERLP